MSPAKGKRIRCDWCGKLSNNRRGEYTRQDGSAGYINCADAENDDGRDKCDECREKPKD